MGLLKEAFYAFAGETFHSFYLTRDVLELALQEAGFVDCCIIENPLPNATVIDYCVTAKREICW